MRRDLEALLRLIEARQAVPFAWGRPGDCVSFAAAAIHAQFGRDPIGRHRWTTRRGALRVARRLGGIAAACDAQLTPIAPAMAMRGDIAGVEDELLGIRLMVVEGETLVGPGEHGLVRMQRAAMVRAWSAEPPPTVTDEPDV
jgi:hypothetical protein